MDEIEFEAFVRSGSRGLQQLAWLLTQDWALAEDLTQSALVKVWQRRERVAAGTATGYARRVLLSTYLSWRGRRWNGESPTHPLPELPDSFGTESVDARVPLLDAIRLLSRQQRAVIILRYFCDLTEVETAAALGCTVGTVKKQNARALTSLRRVPGLDPTRNGV